MHFTNQDIDNAKSVDLVSLARYMGYTPKRIGAMYTLAEHDSVRIRSNGLTYNRYSTGTGGDAINFVREFGNLPFGEAIEYILQFKGVNPEQHHTKIEKLKSEEKTSKEMILPEKSERYQRLFAYLIKTRKLSPEIVQYCVKEHLIYESKDHHNIVFLSKDKDGVVRHAFMRGTNDDFPFKGDVPGNDKRYGFNLSGSSDTLYVYEAAIDALSDLDMDRNWTVSRLALGMLSDAPLETFLQEHPNIKKIEFRMDNDEHGMKAMKELDMKYTGLGYETKQCPPVFPKGTVGKDYNDLLIVKKNAMPIIHPARVGR